MKASVTTKRNYETPEAILRGLIVRGFVKTEDYPYESCTCRGCRLVRKAYKLAELPLPSAR